MTNGFYKIVRQELETCGWQADLALEAVTKRLHSAENFAATEQAIRVAINFAISAVLANSRQATRRGLWEAVQDAPSVPSLPDETKVLHDIRRAQKFERGREAVRNLLDSYRLADGTALGDATASLLLFEADKRDKIGKSNLAEARFLKAVASAIGDKTAREVLSPDAVSEIYQETQKEAIPA